MCVFFFSYVSVMNGKQAVIRFEAGERDSNLANVCVLSISEHTKLARLCATEREGERRPRCPYHAFKDYAPRQGYMPLVPNYVV